MQIPPLPPERTLRALLRFVRRMREQWAPAERLRLCDGQLEIDRCPPPSFPPDDPVRWIMLPPDSFANIDYLGELRAWNLNTIRGDLAQLKYIVT